MFFSACAGLYCKFIYVFFLSNKSCPVVNTTKEIKENTGKHAKFCTMCARNEHLSLCECLIRLNVAQHQNSKAVG